MSNNSWQRKAPVIALLFAVGAAGVVAMMQAEEATPVASTPAQGPDALSSPAAEPSVATREHALANRSDDATTDDHAHDSAPVSDQDIQAEMLEGLSALETEFLSEPVSESWSGGTERMIAESLSEARLAANEAPIPISHDSECRSNTCRIRVTYRSAMDAQMGEIFLLGGIAERLPTANFGRLEAPDGSVQIVMYANTGPAKKTH